VDRLKIISRLPAVITVISKPFFLPVILIWFIVTGNNLCVLPKKKYCSICNFGRPKTNICVPSSFWQLPKFWIKCQLTNFENGKIIENGFCLLKTKYLKRNKNCNFLKMIINWFEPSLEYIPPFYYFFFPITLC
jgi:hypothetical protein